MRVFRSQFGRLMRSILARRNLVLVPTDSLPRDSAFVAGAVARLGIDLVLDVGANDGSTGQWLRASGYKGRIVSFEPQTDVFLALQRAAAEDPSWECRQLALGAADGMIRMQVSGFSPSSSLLSIGDKHIQVWPESRTVGEEDVPIARLDSLADEIGLASNTTLLKLDVQGYEDQVLIGAADLLPQIDAVYAELLFAPLYDGQSEYHEVMATLERAGLRFSGLYEEFSDPSTGLPLFANGLFVRHCERLASKSNGDRP
jgi:FkbM family methyltransferase